MAKFICTTDYPVVETKAGKLKGYVWEDTFTFKGIKYADAERFQMPQPVKPWEGIKDAMSYGMVCPLMEQDNPTMEVLIPHMYWPMDENCQYLNIWTPSIDKDAKKPVMVWLHGGGFFAGSSIEQVAYEGTNMSRHGDVVVVSLNHRLNILGYLDLEPFGEKYKNSGNAGTADMVAALQWIHDNIAAFGGDPENVTIFGQSGGGAKVFTLMQTPAAHGLFHKGIIQSGVYERMQEEGNTDGEKIVTAMLEELGLTADQVEKLETIPYPQMVEAYQKVAPKVAKEGYYVGNEPRPDDYYLGDPVKVGFCEEAKKIPVLIGSVMGEFDFGHGVAGKYEKTPEEVMELLEAKYGKDSAELLELFKKAYPDKCTTDLLSLDCLFRKPTIAFVKERVKSEESRTYSYMFTYEFAWDDGKAPWHCSEIPLVFHNRELIPIYNGSDDMEKLEETFFHAWMQFAKTGKPEIEGVEWPEDQPGDEAVMILDKKCEVRHNFDHELMVLHHKVTGGWKHLQADNLQH